MSAMCWEPTRPARYQRLTAPNRLIKSQGFVKPEVDGNTIIDKRYVVPLP